MLIFFYSFFFIFWSDRFWFILCLLKLLILRRLKRKSFSLCVRVFLGREEIFLSFKFFWEFFFRDFLCPPFFCLEGFGLFYFTLEAS